MAIKYGFYDSLNEDRVYDSKTFSIPFSHIIKDGVFSDYGMQFKTTVVGGMAVQVDTGASWFSGRWTETDAPETLTLSVADASLPRIDRVVLRHDSTPAVRSNQLMVLVGTPASIPQPPIMSRTGVIDDMLIADIRIPAGTTELAQSAVTNYVGRAQTPYVTAPLSSVDVSPIIEQYDETFGEWFEGIQGVLEGDIAANLASKVTSLEKQDVTFQKALTDLDAKIGQTNTTDTGWVPVPVLSGWKTSGEFSARVIDNRLYWAGTFQRTSRPKQALTVSVKIADWPTAIKTALTTAGWPSYFRPCGQANSMSGTYCQLTADNSALWLQYRNRNPYSGEWLTGSIMGAVL